MRVDSLNIGDVWCYPGANELFEYIGCRYWNGERQYTHSQYGGNGYDMYTDGDVEVTFIKYAAEARHQELFFDIEQDIEINGGRAPQSQTVLDAVIEKYGDKDEIECEAEDVDIWDDEIRIEPGILQQITNNVEPYRGNYTQEQIRDIIEDVMHQMENQPQ